MEGQDENTVQGPNQRGCDVTEENWQISRGCSVTSAALCGCRIVSTGSASFPSHLELCKT